METTYYTITLSRRKPSPTRESEPKRRLNVLHIATFMSSLIIATLLFLAVFTVPQGEATPNGAIVTDELTKWREPVSSGIRHAKEGIDEVEPLPEVTETIAPTLDELLGDSIIEMENAVLVMQPLPDEYYPGVNYSKFQPYMDWSMVTNPRSAAYAITRSENAYVDENGYRRYPTTDGQFTIDGADDFVVALGTFYKPKGTCGQRFLIVTTGGMYTVICGDEKADIHTEEMNMFTWHGDSHEYAGLIEWIVDQKVLYQNDNIASRMGSIHYSSNPVLAGDIIMMYRID